jgi:hypothetical protein
MEQKTIQKFVAAFEEVAKQMNAEDYDWMADRAAQMVPMIRITADLIEKSKSRADLTAWLEKFPEPEPSLVDFIVRAVHTVPRAFGSTIRDIVMTHNLPSPLKGRPRISQKTAYEVCTFISDLYGRNGVPILHAKQRAARRFGLSPRSIDRLWTDRARILRNSDHEITEGLWRRFAEVMRNPEGFQKLVGKEQGIKMKSKKRVDRPNSP